MAGMKSLGNPLKMRYQLYFFDSHHYLGSATVEAGNDLGAERVARALGGNSGVELWQGERKVRSIAGANRKLLSPPAPPQHPTPA